MKTINIIMILALMLVLAACGNAQYCIKIEGSAGKYGIDDASVELCRDATLSAQENAEIYRSNTGEVFAIMNMKYVDYVNKQYGEAKSVQTGSRIKQFTELNKQNVD